MTNPATLLNYVANACSVIYEGDFQRFYIWWDILLVSNL